MKFIILNKVLNSPVACEDEAIQSFPLLVSA